jgi:acyl carrier protein
MLLGADSLDEIEICVEVEKEFNIKISDADFEKVKTVNDLCECIEKFL